MSKSGRPGRRTLGDFGLELDVAGDVVDMTAVQWMLQREGKPAVWMLGGGVPVSQIIGLDA